MSEYDFETKSIWELEDMYKEASRKCRQLEKILDEEDPDNRENNRGILREIYALEHLMNGIDDTIERSLAPEKNSPQTLRFTELEQRIRDLQNTEKQNDLLDYRIEWTRRKQKLYLLTEDDLKKRLEISRKDVDSIYLDEVQLAKDIDTFGKEAVDAYIEKETILQAAVELELSIRGDKYNE